MVKKLHLFSLQALLSSALFSQMWTHRLRFKYRIKQSKINISTPSRTSSILTDGAGNPVSIYNNNLLNCLINNNGVLTIDPCVNPTTTDTDPNINTPGIVKATTPYPLIIDIRRGGGTLGTPVLVGHPTKSVTFYYQTWLIGVNTSKVKFRPKVKDYNGNEYSVNVITGAINAGLTIGYSFDHTTFNHHSTTSWSLALAFSNGLASASLAKEPLRNQIITVYRPSALIISPTLGIIVERNDLGLFFTYGHRLIKENTFMELVFQALNY